MHKLNITNMIVTCAHLPNYGYTFIEFKHVHCSRYTKRNFHAMGSYGMKNIEFSLKRRLWRLFFLVLIAL